MQQFGTQGFGWSHLALYDVFDAERFSLEHADNALTRRMMVTDAIATDALNDFHYYPLQFRDKDPETAHTGGVILEQLRPAAGREADFRAWYDDIYFPAALRRPGVHSGAFLAYRSYGQLVDFPPAHSHVGIYRVADAGAVAAWRASGDLATDLIDDVAVTCWEPITARLNEDRVLHTNAADLAAEERARAHMGTNVLSDRGTQLRLD